MITTIIAFVLALAPLVFFHEFGHYWVAKRCGVAIESFSIGFGPTLLQWKDSAGTCWKICAFWLGGYVKMKGDSQEGGFHPGDSGPAAHSRVLDCFQDKTPFQKILIALAGPVANFIVAAALFFAVFSFAGKPDMPAVVGKVTRETPAGKYLRFQDKILSVQGKEVKNFQDVVVVLGETSASEPLNFVIERDHTPLKVTMPILSADATGVWKGKLGLMPDTEGMSWQKMSISQAFHEATEVLWRSIIAPFQLLKMGQWRSMGGPLGIAHQAGTIFAQGLPAFLLFMAGLSVGLGAINLFPLPIFDGGNVVISLIEWVRGKALSDKVQEWIARISLGLLALAFISLSWNDLSKIMKW
ncbi:MAG: hypothetical protein BGO07_04985 [Alphaproteobacteria bacterium 40-19]|nr:MAG: hypothetical protein BGO07_04985 [Alphaproteobacteria bacterium 40-19]